jgi:WD40 repeat protein
VLAGCSDKPPVPGVPEPAPAHVQQPQNTVQSATPALSPASPGQPAPARPPTVEERRQSLLEAELAAVPNEGDQSPDAALVEEIAQMAGELPARPLPSDSRTISNAELRVRELLWLLDLYAETFRRGSPDPKWEQEAWHFIEAVVATRAAGESMDPALVETARDDLAAGRPFTFLHPLTEVGGLKRHSAGRGGLRPDFAKELYADGDELTRQGCQNPVVLHCQAYIVSKLGSYPVAGNFVDTLRRAIAGYDELGSSPLLALDAELMMTEAKDISGNDQAQRRERAMKLMARALSSPPSDSRERRFLYHHLRRQIEKFSGHDFGATLRQLIEIVGAVPDGDPWLTKMIAAAGHRAIASEVRDAAPAENTPPELLRIITAHSARARTLLVEAWNLDRLSPEPATLLIDGLEPNGGVAGEPARFWLDQALMAQFDNPDAYAAFRSTLFAKSGVPFLIDTDDDVDAVLEFSRELLATNRFDTGVPMEYQTALEQIAQIMKGYGPVLRRPGVMDDLRKLIAGYRAVASNSALEARADSWLAGIEWLRGNRSAAAAIASRLADRADVELLANLDVTAEALGTRAAEIADAGEAITAMRVSGDGRTLLTGTADGTVRLCDASDGRELARKKVRAAGISSIASSTDGQWTAVCDQTGRIALVAASGFERKHELEFGNGPLTAAFSPDGRLLAAAGTGESAATGVALWEVATGSRQGTALNEIDSIGAIAFSPDGRHLAAGTQRGEIVFWDMESQHVLRRAAAFQSALYDLAYSRDGSRIATAGMDLLKLNQVTVQYVGPAFVPTRPLHRIRVFDSQTGAILRTISGHWGQVGAVAFAAHDKKLVSASADRTVRVWDVDSGREVARLIAQTGPLATIAISPGQNFLFAPGAEGTVQRLEIPQEGERYVTQGDPLRIDFRGLSGIALRPGGDLVVFDREAGAMVWRAASGYHDGVNLAVTEFPRIFAQAALSPDGAHVAIPVNNDNLLEMRGLPWLGTRDAPCCDIRIHDAESGELQRTLTLVDTHAYCLTWLPDGKRLVAGMELGRIAFWDVNGARLEAWPPLIIDEKTRGEQRMNTRGAAEEFRSEVGAVATNASGDRLAAGDRDGRVEVWALPSAGSAQSEAPKSLGVLQRLGGWVYRLYFMHDGRQLLVGVESNIFGSSTFVVDLGSFKIYRTIPRRLLALSPDGKMIAVSDLKTIRVLDADSFRPLATIPLRAGQEPLTAVFSPDGRFILSGTGARGSLSVWSMESAEAVIDLQTALGTHRPGSDSGIVPPPPAAFAAGFIASPPTYVLHDGDQFESRLAALRMIEAGGIIKIAVSGRTDSVASARDLRMGPFTLTGVSFAKSPNRASIGDAYLSGLSVVSHLLTELDLQETAVTDGSAPIFSRMTQLKTLNLRGTGFSDEALGELQKVLPDCNIVR